MQRAFTLIELAVVIAIIATAAAITLPRYASAQGRYKLDSAARLLAQHLERLARRAETSSQAINVTIDLAADQIVARDATNPSIVIASLTISGSPWNVDMIAADFSGERKFTIDAFGLPSSDGTIEISHAGERRIISLSRATGEAAVLRPGELEPDPDLIAPIIVARARDVGEGVRDLARAPLVARTG
jgi:prepilin-type N-terminal cleavage/methylation domain-containing protein